MRETEVVAVRWSDGDPSVGVEGVGGGDTWDRYWRAEQGNDPDCSLLARIGALPRLPTVHEPARVFRPLEAACGPPGCGGQRSPARVRGMTQDRAPSNLAAPVRDRLRALACGGGEGGRDPS
jgi:hypothetical protein